MREVMAMLVEAPGEKGTRGDPAMDVLWTAVNAWEAMQMCAKPLMELTVPSEVAQEKEFDQVLTLEILRTEEDLPTLETLGKVVEPVEGLYQAFLSLQKKGSTEPLRIIYLASGSSLRVDLKGLGEPIKHIKNLLVEGWSLWRHRKATELAQNSRALLASLKTFAEVDKYVRSGAMRKADGDALKARIQKAMLGLFGEGALPREIPTVESVSNFTLIDFGGPKRLRNAPAVPSEAIAKPGQPPAPGEVEVIETQIRGQAKQSGKKSSKSARQQNLGAA
jgi:hypothetical protein